MAFRFVHAADVHLAPPMRTLALRNADLRGLIGNATRRAFTRIVDLCLRERVDALLLSGNRIKTCAAIARSITAKAVGLPRRYLGLS